MSFEKYLFEMISKTHVEFHTNYR